MAVAMAVPKRRARTRARMRYAEGRRVMGRWEAGCMRSGAVGLGRGEIVPRRKPEGRWPMVAAAVKRRASNAAHMQESTRQRE
jgi:hypothetical protein